MPPTEDPTRDFQAAPPPEDDDETGFFPADDEDDAPTTGASHPDSPAPSGVPSSVPDAPTSLFDAPTAGADASSPATVEDTQVLQTQVASREELEQMRALYQQRRRRRVSARFGLLVVVAAAAVGLSVWVSTREPEKFLKMPQPADSTTLLPALAPEPALAEIAGSVGVSYPKENASILCNASNTFEAVVLIGRSRDVPVRLVFEAYLDPAATTETREASFRRHLETSPEMVVALDAMLALPDEDFFGGREGLRRGIPCSRREYRCMRDSKPVYGVVSFFRCGALCCSFRREVAASERGRAQHQLEPTRAWLWADRAGAFAASQWEGAPDAGCPDPDHELARCRARLDVESPAEWPGIETGLRDVLVVSASTSDADRERRAAALRLLAVLRGRKALHWKQLVARRAPFPAAIRPGDNVGPEAAAVDAVVRRDFPDPAEEWYFLAHRKEWWR